MIDFENASFVKLRSANVYNMDKQINAILVEGENVVEFFQGFRDMVVFTNKRIISVNVQGITGKKKDYTSLPYSKIQTFSVETAGTFDLDSELTLWFSGVGKVKFEFISSADIVGICKAIGEHVL